MAGTGIQIRIDDAAVRAAFGRRLLRVRDLRPVFDAIGAALVVSTQRRFEAQRSPAGAPWQPLSEITVLGRRGGSSGSAYDKRGRLTARGGAGAAILRDTGQLVQSLTHRAGSDQVAVGTNKIYGRLHQLGGVIRPKTARRLAWGAGAWRFFAKQVTIPARPFLGLDAGDRAMIGRTLLRHLGEAAR